MHINALYFRVKVFYSFRISESKVDLRVTLGYWSHPVFLTFGLSSATHSRLPAPQKNLHQPKVPHGPISAGREWVTFACFRLNLVLLQQARSDLRVGAILYV